MPFTRVACESVLARFEERLRGVYSVWFMVHGKVGKQMMLELLVLTIYV